MKTLILCTNVTALRQWREEILQRTTLEPDQVAEYTGDSKDIAAVTLTTYQMLTWRRSRTEEFVHFGLFDRANWGLILYDEVHLLPAPVFRSVAQLQARRRLGLTATLVREDGKQGDVFALIGPKRFDMPWKDLEHQGWIASASCTEIRVGLSEDDRLRYAVADDREKYRIASTNPRKGPVIDELLERHKGDRVLILGMYIEQLEWMAARWRLPIITGLTVMALGLVTLYGRWHDAGARGVRISHSPHSTIAPPATSAAIRCTDASRPATSTRSATRCTRTAAPIATARGAKTTARCCCAWASPGPASAT